MRTSPCSLPRAVGSRRFATSLAGALLLGLTACAGTSTVVSQPLQGNLNAFQTAVIRVEEKVDDDVSAELQSLSSQVVAGIEKRKLFAAVSDHAAVEASDGAADSRLQICATITNVRKVSGSARFWGGAFAGKAHFVVRVDLLDAGGKCLASYEVDGASGSTGMSGGTDSAVANAAKGIVDELAALRRRK